jgi:carbon-monoxide dehydrogenase small subunit
VNRDVNDTAIHYTVNGEDRAYDGAPMARLLDVLRTDLQLTGTKEGCGEGECGACTVLLDGEPVCSCLVPMLQMGGRAVVSVEGLAEDGAPDPIQRAFIDAGGVQCGACTPGLLVSAKALLDREPSPSRDLVREALAGNLCRCTGYERIFQAVDAAAAARREAGGEGTS